MAEAESFLGRQGREREQIEGTSSDDMRRLIALARTGWGSWRTASGAGCAPIA